MRNYAASSSVDYRRLRSLVVAVTIKMPQELHVVRCYACKLFQVQIVKKIPKWQCKVCNEKQSVLKVYAQGSGKDCRQYVQDLNMKQGLLMSSEPQNENSPSYANDSPMPMHVSDNCHKASKWSGYLVEDVDSSDVVDESPYDDQDEQNRTVSLKFRLNKQKRKRDHRINCENEGYDHAEEYHQDISEVSHYSSGAVFPDGTKKLKSSVHRFSTKGTSAEINKSKQSKWLDFITQDDGSSSLNSTHSGQDTLLMEEFESNGVNGNQDLTGTGPIKNGKMPSMPGAERPSHLVDNSMKIADNTSLILCHSLEMAPKNENSNFTANAIPCLDINGSNSKWSQFISENVGAVASASLESNLDTVSKSSKIRNLDHNFDSNYSPCQTEKMQNSYGNKLSSIPFKNSYTTTTKNPLHVNYEPECQGKIVSQSHSAFRSPFCNTDDENLDNILDF